MRITEANKAIVRQLATVEDIEELELVQAAIQVRKEELRIEIAKKFNVGDRVSFPGKKRGRHAGRQVGHITDKRGGLLWIDCGVVQWYKVRPETCTKLGE